MRREMIGVEDQGPRRDGLLGSNCFIHSLICVCLDQKTWHHVSQNAFFSSVCLLYTKCWKMCFLYRKCKMYDGRTHESRREVRNSFFVNVVVLHRKMENISTDAEALRHSYRLSAPRRQSGKVKRLLAGEGGGQENRIERQPNRHRRAGV